MTPLLSVKGITRSDGRQTGCADMSFDLFPGEVMGIVGESGSGKTTLLDCLAGQLHPDRGRVLFDTRIGDCPSTFSGGMQQRLQIARNLVSGPRLAFMDEPTGGLDVSVQARLLDLLRGLVRDMGLSAIIVTHDLAVMRLLADRLMGMKDRRVVEKQAHRSAVR